MAEKHPIGPLRRAIGAYAKAQCEDRDTAKELAELGDALTYAVGTETETDLVSACALTILMDLSGRQTMYHVGDYVRRQLRQQEGRTDA